MSSVGDLLKTGTCPCTGEEKQEDPENLPSTAQLGSDQALAWQDVLFLVSYAASCSSNVPVYRLAGNLIRLSRQHGWSGVGSENLCF